MPKYKRRFFDPKYYPVERRRPQIFCCLLFWSFLAYRLISQFVVAGTQVVGESMYPTLRDGDRYVINRVVYRRTNPKRGDLVAIERPMDSDTLVKRIIALPGERVQICGGRIYINDHELHEPYLPARTHTAPGYFGTNVHVVPPDAYFVLGDNRAQSEDSRYFGWVYRDWLGGQIVQLARR